MSLSATMKGTQMDMNMAFNVAMDQGAGDLFLRRKEEMEKQIEEWKKILDVINYKCEYYQKAVEAGTEKHLFAKDKLPHADEFITAMPSLPNPQTSEN